MPEILPLGNKFGVADGAIHNSCTYTQCVSYHAQASNGNTILTDSAFS